MSTGLAIVQLDAGYARLSVLRAVDLVVEPGTITALLGPNGAGKTTLLRSVTGLAKVYRGRVTVGDRDISGARAGAVVAAGIGGQQQMLALAQVLIREPKVLLLDEPSLGLAPSIVGEVFATLRVLRESGMTTLIVEQAVDAAIELSDHVYVMAGGTVVLHGPPDDVRDHPALTEAFLGSGPTSTERNLLP